MGVDYYMCCMAHRESLELGGYLNVDCGDEGHDRGVVTDRNLFVESLRKYELAYRGQRAGILDRALVVVDHFVARHSRCQVWAFSSYNEKKLLLNAETDPEEPLIGPDGKPLEWTEFSFYNDAAADPHSKGIDLVGQVDATPLRAPQPGTKPAPPWRRP